MTRRLTLVLSALALIGWTPAAYSDESPTVLELWPGAAPGETKPIGEEKLLPSKPEERCQKKLTNVSRPTIAVHRPPKDKDTGAAVVIAPGGAYSILAMDLEGEEVASWLNSIGITGIILKYRVPRRPEQPRDQPPVGALQDAQRAVGLVRNKAAEWGIDPKRIGMLGFSAGGHLTAWTATNSDRRSYEPVDEADKESCRPDFAVLIYPAYLQKSATPRELNADIRVSSNTPPCFFAHAGNDSISPENSVTMYLALKRAGVPAELHIYNKGGHGFGLRPEGTPCSTWPQRCAEWLRDRGILAREKG
jgi:acetyl esterase/lipase